MVMSQLLENTSFLVDKTGRRTAAVIEISVWEELLKTLEVQSMPKLDPKRVIRLPSVRLAKGSKRPKMTMKIERGND